MFRIRCLFLVFSMATMSYAVSAQDIGYGFRAGLTYAKFTGDSEIGANGEELESFSFASGFHIGFTVNYKITDLFGVRGELMFVQKGTQYDFNGESWFILGQNASNEINLPGMRIQDLDISTATIEIPLSVYHKLGPFELSAGADVSFLLGAAAGGTLHYEGRSPATGNAIDPFVVRLNYNYFKDNAGAASLTTFPVLVDGSTYDVPTTFGAYYRFDEKDGNYFNTLDVGLHAGLAFFLNESLFLGVRANWGMLDVDDNQYDISLRELGAGRSYIPREDKNTSITLQASIGFSF